MNHHNYVPGSGEYMPENKFEEIGLEYATRMVNSGPVIMISAAYGNERAVMTVAWNMPVQKSPPLIAIAIGTKHHTTGIIEQSGEFIINIPGHEILDVVKYCGSVSGHRESKFESGKFDTTMGKIVYAPVLSGVMGIIECKVARTVNMGNHGIYLGRAVRCAARKGCFHEVWKVSEGKAQLIHHLGGSYFYNPKP